MEEVRELEKWSAVKRFFKMLELDRKDISYVYSYAIFAGLITLSLPLGIQAIIGFLIGGALSTSLLVLIGIVTIGTALTGVLKIMQITVTETLQRRIFARSAIEFAYRIPRFNYEKMMDDHPPELINRFFDTLTLQKGVPKLLMDFSTAVLQIVFGLLLISFYHPFFVFFGLVLIGILLLIFRTTGPGGLKTSLMESKYKYKVVYWLEEMARALTTFKMAGNSKLALNETDKLVSGYLESRKNHFRILLIQYANIVGFKTIITLGLLLLGSTLVINNSINIGQFVAAEIVVILILASVEKLILSMETIYDVLTAVEKIGSVVDIPLDSEEGLHYKEVQDEKGLAIDLDKVAFTFKNASKPVINDLSLSIKPGESVCVAGYNGAGKGTLIQLVSGLYREFSGSIRYNGFPLKNLNLNSLRQNIGNYTKHSDIFRGSIMDNICLEQDELSMTDILWATEKTKLTEFIQKQPKGYESELLPGGSNIPQSARTKILLARSIVKRPQLLAFEDIFTDLEWNDQKDILKFLTSPKLGWTLMTVSNNPFVAAHFDKVVILKEGKIAAEGAFKDLYGNPAFEEIFNPTPIGLNNIFEPVKL